MANRNSTIVFDGAGVDPAFDGDRGKDQPMVRNDLLPSYAPVASGQYSEMKRQTSRNNFNLFSMLQKAKYKNKLNEKDVKMKCLSIDRESAYHLSEIRIKSLKVTKDQKALLASMELMNPMTAAPNPDHNSFYARKRGNKINHHFARMFPALIKKDKTKTNDPKLALKSSSPSPNRSLSTDSPIDQRKPEFESKAMIKSRSMLKSTLKTLVNANISSTVKQSHTQTSNSLLMDSLIHKSRSRRINYTKLNLTKNNQSGQSILDMTLNLAGTQKSKNVLSDIEQQRRMKERLMMRGLDAPLSLNRTPINEGEDYYLSAFSNIGDLYEKMTYQNYPELIGKEDIYELRFKKRDKVKQYFAEKVRIIQTDSNRSLLSRQSALDRDTPADIDSMINRHKLNRSYTKQRSMLK